MRNLSHLDDNQCIALAQSGESRAFSVLMTRYQDQVYRFLLRLTRSPDDALDLTQETFLRAYQALDRWRADALFKTWLFRIARNTAFDLLRRDKLVEFVALEDELEIPDPTAEPDTLLETAQRYQQLETALQALPLVHREILLLREIEQMSYDEISVVLSINVGTVKSRIARGRSALLNGIKNISELSP